jgi:hypothetical protein
VPDPLPTSDGRLTYEQWVAYCFDRDQRDWYWAQFADAQDEYGNPLDRDWYRPAPDVLCEYLTTFFRDPSGIADRYSRDQIAWATWFIFGIGSAWMWVRLDRSVPEAARVALVGSIYDAYERLYAPLCAGLEGVDAKEDPLAIACFMIWDMDCLWPPDEQGFAAIKDAQYRVLERSLEIPSNVVRKSALHGLGDTHYLTDPGRVAAIIDRFLVANPVLPGSLFDYAIDARAGNVQ